MLTSFNSRVSECFAEQYEAAHRAEVLNNMGALRVWWDSLTPEQYTLKSPIHKAGGEWLSILCKAQAEVHRYDGEWMVEYNHAFKS